MSKKSNKKEPEFIDELTQDVEKYVKILKKNFKKAQKEAKEYLDGWQRERADFINYKKDIESYLERGRQNVKEEVLLQYINTVDNIELMIEHAHDAIIKTDWWAGVENAHKHALGALKNLGVEEIQTKMGDKFDPELHEAVDGEGDIIAEVLKKGYKMGDPSNPSGQARILRPAQVKVKNK